jgi:hypothetical protein
MEVLLPVRTCSEPNLRGHWGKRARRFRAQRTTTRSLLGSVFRALPADDPLRAATPKLTVRLTRIAPRRLDSDNLAGALKAVRDGVADALGLDDADGSVRWLYDQRRGAPGQYAVVVEVKADDEG